MSFTLGSLFDGLGGWLIASIHNNVTPIWASEIENFPIAVTKHHFPNVKHLGDARKINGAEIEPVDILCAGTPCFRMGTLISTHRGQIPIEEVKVGDLVLTHKNRYRKVIKTGNKKSNNLYCLKVMGSPRTYVTGNHPYYVREMSQVWDNSLRRYVRQFSEPMWKSVEDLESGDFVGFPINTESSNIYNLTTEECYLLGRYIADGYIRNNKRPHRANSYNHQVIFCIGKRKKDDFIKEISQYHVCLREDKAVYKAVIISERLMNLCHMCGRGACNKEIPSFILDLPTSHLEKFLDGYMSGDGCFTNNQFTATTISCKLAFGLQQVVHKLYHTPCKIYYCARPKTCVIEGRIVNQHDTWQIAFNKEIKKQNKAVYIDGIMWMPFKSKEKDDNCVVYNLEVSVEHSYTANGVIVHNCQNLSVAGNREGLEGQESSLFYQATRILKEMRKATNGEYPKYFVWENVYGTFSSNRGYDFKAVLEEITETNIPMPKSSKWANAGMVRSSKCGVAWRVLDAQYWGVPQKRKRIFLVADFGDGRSKEIFFESEGLFGGFAESNKERKDIAEGVRESIKNSSKYIVYMNNKFGGFAETDKAQTLKASGGDIGGGSENLVQSFDTVRKLTPLECERLNGLPDNYTLIDDKSCNNTARYKALGNGMAQPCADFIISCLVR